MDKLICKICDLEFNSFVSLGIHITRTHKIKSKLYYDKFLKKENEGACAYSKCNNETTFRNLKEGY